MENAMSRRSFVGGLGLGAAAAAVAATGVSVAHADETAEAEATEEVAEEEATEEAAAEETTEETTEEETSTSSWRTAPDPVDESEIVATYDVQVGIIGLGHAGLAVMRSAAEAGATVVAVETQPEDSWWTIGHDIGHINSQALADQGVPEVDEVEFINNWMLMANNKCNGSFVSYFAKHSGEDVDWWLEQADPELVSQLRVGFFPDNEYTVHELNNGLHYYAGNLEIWTDVWEAREAATPGVDTVDADALNNTDGLEVKDIDRSNLVYVQETYPDTVTTLFETTGYYLLQDDDGSVTGFIAEGPDGYVQVNASNGVVLAGGGFGGNEEMRNDLLPAVVNMYTPDESMMCMFDRDGSAIAMGVWAGGHLESEISSMNFDVTYSPDVLVGPLWVNDKGERFQNEAFGGTELNGLFMARAMRGQQISIFDNTLEQQLMSGIPCHSGLDWSNGWDVPNTLAKFQAAEGMGAEGADGYYCADTLDELADYLGFEGDTKETFLATVEEYNEMCAAGADTDFGKDPHFLIPVENAPFYAHANAGAPGFALVTTGGFVTDNDQMVLDDYYNPIEGLYAVGNCCGMRFGPTYITPVPGVSIGMCYCLGRKLGEHLATL